MAIKGSRKGGKARAAPKKKKRSAPKSIPARKHEPVSENAGSGPTEEQFIRGVLIRGEGAPPNKEGELPPGATHIVTEDEEGRPEIEIERDRFSLY